MRTACLLLVLVAACKEKQEIKPAPAAPPAPVAEVKEPAPAPPPIDTKPTGAQHVVKPAGGITTQIEYETKAFELTDKLTSVFAAAGTNCNKLASNLDVFLDENKAALQGTDEFEAANPFAEDDLEPKLQTRAKALIQKMAISMKACGKHEGVQTALAKLPD